MQTDGNMAADLIHKELDDIAIHILTLSQDLINVKLELAQITKEGFIGLAESRKSMGGRGNVSRHHIPSQKSSSSTVRFCSITNEATSGSPGVIFTGIIKEYPPIFRERFTTFYARILVDITIQISPDSPYCFLIFL